MAGNLRQKVRGCIKILVHPLFRIIFLNKASTFTSRGFAISQKFSIFVV